MRSDHFLKDYSYNNPPLAYIRQVSYKATRTGQINNPLVKAGGNFYGTGCGFTSCPYNLVVGDESISGTSFLYVGVGKK